MFHWNLLGCVFAEESTTTQFSSTAKVVSQTTTMETRSKLSSTTTKTRISTVTVTPCDDDMSDKEPEPVGVIPGVQCAYVAPGVIPPESKTEAVIAADDEVPLLSFLS